MTSTSDANGLINFLFTGTQRDINNWDIWWDQIGYIFYNLRSFSSLNTSITTNGMTITFKVTDSSSGITLINTTNDGSEFYNSINNSTVTTHNSSNIFGVWVSKYMKINLYES